MSLQGSLSPDYPPHSVCTETVGDQGHTPPTAKNHVSDHALLKDQQYNIENNLKMTMTDEFVSTPSGNAARPSQGQPLPWGPRLQLATCLQGDPPLLPVVLPCTSYKPCLGLRSCVWDSHWPGLSAQGKLAFILLKRNANMVCKCSHLGKDPLLFSKNLHPPASSLIASVILHFEPAQC